MGRIFSSEKSEGPGRIRTQDPLLLSLTTRPLSPHDMTEIVDLDVKHEHKQIPYDKKKNLCRKQYLQHVEKQYISLVFVIY